VLANTRWPK